MLGGFGDLNVDRSATSGDAKAAAGKGGASTALTLQPAELMRLRPLELKKKLKDVGVDLAKHPGAVEKKVRLHRQGGAGGRGGRLGEQNEKAFVVRGVGVLWVRTECGRFCR